MKINNKMRSGWIALVAFSALLICAIAGLSQDHSQLTSFTNQVKNFEFSLPSDYLVDREGETVRIYSYSGTSWVIVSTEKMQKPKAYIKGLKYLLDKSTGSENFELGEFLVRRFEYDFEGDFSTSIVLASSDDYFHIKASSSKKNDPTLARFLQSIRINKNPVFANTLPASENNATPLIFKNLPASQLVLDSVTKPHNVTTKVQFNEVKGEAPAYDPSYSRGLIILRKPQGSYTDSARMKNKQGTIRARIDFLRDGQIGKITVDSALDKGLAASVASVVKQLKFIPAEINGNLWM